jgi:hypothetical protein
MKENSVLFYLNNSKAEFQKDFWDSAMNTLQRKLEMCEWGIDALLPHEQLLVQILAGGWTAEYNQGQEPMFDTDLLYQVKETEI